MLKFSQVIGLPVTVGDIDSTADDIVKSGKASIRAHVCIANVHMVIIAKTNKLLRAAMDASIIVTSDGMPLVWELKRQGYKEAKRVSGPDLMLELCERAQTEKLPIYFYGGSPTVVEVMKEKLTKNYPDLLIAGIESPPMLSKKPKVDLEIVERIKESGARIVFVGLGCPKQELWMLAYSPHLPAVLIGVGAAFDFFSGSVKRAPFWMQKSGLEWFYRLCSEPRRLWKRYLVTNTLFILYWMLERLGRAK